MKQKITAIVSCLLVGVVACTMIVPALIQRTLIDSSEKTISYDGSVDYPLQDSEGENINSKKNYDVIDKALKKFDKIKRYSETISSENYMYKMPFVLTKKRWDKYTGIDMTTSVSNNDTSGTIVDVGEGTMSYIVNNFYPENIEGLIDFGKQTEEKGINFMLLLTPFKLDKDSKIQSGIYKNCSDEIEEKYVKMVKESGLNIVALSDAIKEEDLDRQSMFFKTDHHWLPQTGLWANKIMSEYLNKNMGFSIDTDVFSEEKYNIEYLDEEWLGSLGKKATTVYCEPEPFPVVTPKYDTDLTVFISKLNKTISGPVQDVLLEWEKLEESDIYKRRNYELYAYGDIALLSIHNNMVKDGRRVLMIKCSFADVMIPSFATVVENLDVIDLRAFKGSLQSYIEETKPDTIIMVYGTSEATGESAYDFR